MERVTEWRGDHAAVCNHHVNYIDRLARYEDTDLEPEEINGLKLKIQCLEMSLQVTCNALERFQEVHKEK